MMFAPLPLTPALRLTGIMMALAFIQQSAEHLAGPKDERRLFLPRLLLSLLLLLGIQASWACAGLVGLSLLILRRFQGPYNGGSDRMGLLVLCCLCAALFLPGPRWQEYAFGYLAMQLTLSYAVAGWVKLVNPDWRSGRALQDVFRFSVYPASESLRQWAGRPRLLRWMSWAVIVFEVLFPLAWLSQTTLLIALALAALFHAANACLFGLNRFFWIWLAAYPSLLWLQGRIME
jgi:hypothetical protein